MGSALRIDSLRLEMLFVGFSFLLLLGFASAQYPRWSTISWRDPHGQWRNAQIVRAVGPNNDMNGAIDCTRYFPGECKITLNITHMLTMTLYDYYPEDLKDSGGHRGVDGYAIKINADGSFAFRYDSDNAVPNRDITFLWPIIADAHLKADELERRSVIAVNNQVPGPTIIAQQGQTLNIKVANNLASESISIHWHGQHVKGKPGEPGKPWMDGVAHITQCPIVPYTEFIYSFVADQVGTHWYHAHSGAQRTDGLFGALIIKSDDEFEGTDLENMVDTFEDRPEEHTISLIDWQHDNSIDLFSVIQSGSRFKSPIDGSKSYSFAKIYDGSESAPYPFLSGLINGLGWEFTPVSSSSCNHNNNPLNFFNVSPGGAYRFRLIGAQNAYAFRFSIEGHKLKLLASDGILAKTDPEEVDYIIIHSGERYDFLLDTTRQSSRNYWIVAETLETQDGLRHVGYRCTQGRRAYAILHYTDMPYDSWPPDTTYNTASRCTSSSKCYAVNCPFQEFPQNYNIMCLNVGSFKQRHTLPKQMLEISDATSLFLNFGFGGDTTVAGSSINGRHFLFPPYPPTTQYSDLSEDFKNGKKVCTYPQNINEDKGQRCLHVYNIDNKIVQNEGTVEIVFMNLLDEKQGIGSGQAHPIHLHGHHFQVIHIGYGSCSEDKGICHHPDITCGSTEGHCDMNVGWSDGRTNFGRGIQEPPEKDTVIVPVGGYVVIRFRADNPGWWFLHCHIEPHQLEGMSMVVREGTPPAPPDSFPKCGNFDPAAPPSSTTTEPSPTVIGLAAAFAVSAVLAIVLLIVLVIVCICCVDWD